jgi:hypothetical protein
MTRLPIAAAASLSACAPLDNPAAAISAASLVGGWVPRGELCEGDAGIIYEADGRWTPYGSAGTWRIVRSTLISNVTEEWEDEQPPVRLEKPRTYVRTIEVIGPDSYRSTGGNGSVTEMTRCHDAR